MSLIKEGDIVKVVKVIVPSPYKNSYIGGLFRVGSALPYVVSEGYDINLNGTTFHRDEVELVASAEHCVIPPVGSLVRAIGTTGVVEVQRVYSVVVKVVDAKGFIFEVGQTMSAEECAQHKSKLAAEKKAEIEQKRDLLLAAAQKSLKEAAELSAALAAANLTV